MSEWVLRGDINFVDYGGYIMRQDENNPRQYEVIEVRTSWDTEVLGDNEVYAWMTTVDLDDDWVEWAEALKCIGCDDMRAADDYTKVEAALAYHGIAQWNMMDLGWEDGKLTKRELAQILKGFDAGEFATNDGTPWTLEELNDEAERPRAELVGFQWGPDDVSWTARWCTEDGALLAGRSVDADKLQVGDVVVHYNGVTLNFLGRITEIRPKTSEYYQGKAIAVPYTLDISNSKRSSEFGTYSHDGSGVHVIDTADGKPIM